MAKTGFAFREIEIEGYKFWIDGNSKVTANNGTFENPAANAFSLPHLITCPDKTRRCAKACYVNELKEYSPATYSKFQINHQTIQAVLALPQAQCERIAINFADRKSVV